MLIMALVPCWVAASDLSDFTPTFYTCIILYYLCILVLGSIFIFEVRDVSLFTPAMPLVRIFLLFVHRFTSFLFSDV